MSGSCAIYVPKRQLDVEKKKWGETSAVPIFHLGSPRKTGPTKCQVSFGKLRKKFFFGGLGGVRFPGPSKVANCQSVEDCKKYVIFRDIDGATPSYLPTSINQPNQNMPHRSELSQDRRQNHQERHQSCVFWGIDGATASCLRRTLIDVAYFG